MKGKLNAGRLNIRKMSDTDIPLIEEWLSKEHIRKRFGDPREWLHEIRHRNGKYDWIIHYMVEYDDVSIGFCQY